MRKIINKINRPYYILITKILALTIAVILNSACVHEHYRTPPESLPISKWTTLQLVTRGKSEFENKNYAASVRYLEEAAKRDDKEALYALGFIQYHGLSVPNNPKFAQNLIRRSAELGYEPAIKALRLFLTTRSQLTVDSKSPAYLAQKDTKSNLNNTNTKLAKNNIDSNTIMSATSNNTNKQLAKTQKNKNTPNSIKTLKTEIKNKKDKVEKIVQIAKNKTVNNKNVVKNEIKTAIQAKVEENKSTNHAKPEKLQKRLEVAKVEHAKKTEKVEKVEKVSSLNKQEDKTLSKVAIIPQKNKNNINSEELAPKLSPKKQEPNTSVTQKLANLNKNWLNQQNPDHYTIQVLADDNLEAIEKFIEQNHMENKLNTFSYTYKNKLWYGAGYGVYKKSQDAYSTMLKNMPPELASKKPWVRKFKNIDQQISSTS